MNEFAVPVFDDPHLKSALRRSFPLQSCPLHLRERISYSIKTASLEEDSPASAIPLDPAALASPAHSVSGLNNTIRLSPPAAAPASWSAWAPGLAMAASMVIAV